MYVKIFVLANGADAVVWLRVAAAVIRCYCCCCCLASCLRHACRDPLQCTPCVARHARLSRCWWLCEMMYLPCFVKRLLYIIINCYFLLYEYFIFVCSVSAFFFAPLLQYIAVASVGISTQGFPTSLFPTACGRELLYLRRAESRLKFVLCCQGFEPRTVNMGRV